MAATATMQPMNWKQDMIHAIQNRASGINLNQADVTAQIHPKDGTQASTSGAQQRASTFKDTSKAPPPSLQGSVLADYELGRIIGTGSFGRVHIARHKQSSGTFVIKALSKAACIKDGQVRHVMDEKAMLAKISSAGHPFLVNLRATFQDATTLYLVLDYVPGGEFFAFLRDYPARYGCKMKEDHARFYAAQVILAFEHLHSQGIAFRDLKPENMLMGSDGYIKVTDFGFAKEVGQGTYTMCGTPDYLAPEVIRAQGHGVAVDWWSLGCVVYEMLFGFPPFYSEGDATRTYQKALARQLVFPKHWSDLAKSLIDGLLQVNPQQRLGVAGKGIEEIKAHPWFQGLDWKLILGKRYQPPYKPRVASADDTSNFDDYSKLAPVVHPFPLNPQQQKLFQGF